MLLPASTTSPYRWNTQADPLTKPDQSDYWSFNRGSPQNGFVMVSKSGYIIGGIVIVALSFVATLFVLNTRATHSLAQAPPVPSVTPALSGMGVPTPESALADLPKMEAANLQWIGIAKLNVRTQTGTSMVAGQPILLLLPTQDEGYHTLAGQFTGLNKSQGYRIAAWVKPEAGGNIELEVVDNPDGSPVNHAVGIFDLTRHLVLYGSGAVKDRGIEQAPGDWQKVWLDLATSDGKFVFTIRPSNGAADIFKGDGRFGLTLGGIEAEPKD